LNHEIALLNAIVDSGNVAEAIEQNVDSVFSEHTDVWKFIVEFYSEYSSAPSKDVVKSNFKGFEFVKTEAPLQYYIDDAKKSSLGRGVRSTLYKASEALKNGDDPARILTLIQNEAADLMRGSGRLKDSNIVDYQDRAEILRDRIENPEKSKVGVNSGISVIDNIFGGFQAGDFVVVLGWTGMGKSYLTRLFAANAWREGHTPLIISLEMDRLQEEFRMDTILNAGEKFTNTQLKNGIGIDFDEYQGWAEEMFTDKPPIHLVTAEGVETADQHFVQAKIEQYKPKLTILDYHTLFEDARGGGTETERAKNLSKDFKRMAVRNRTAIIDVSGVTMGDGHEDRPPELSEIAWSKQLAFDADLVMAIHRPREGGLIQCVSRKCRRSPDFAFYLDWDLDSGKWKEVFEADGF
jgi:replicative DNA helicase